MCKKNCVSGWMGAVCAVWLGTALLGIWRTREMPRLEHGTATMIELGTLGDFLGGLGVLFAGLGFVGIVYTFRLQAESNAAQQKQLELQQKASMDEEEAQRKRNYISVVTALAHAQTALYASDPRKYDNEWASATQEPERDPKFVDERKYTVRGKLAYSIKTLEILRDEIRIKGDFVFDHVRQKQDASSSEQQP